MLHFAFKMQHNYYPHAMLVQGIIYDTLNYSRQVNTISTHHPDQTDLILK